MLLGLTYLGMASGDAAVSVPQGAHAGQLTMHPCTYATEKGAYRADCGTLIVDVYKRQDYNAGQLVDATKGA